MLQIVARARFRLVKEILAPVSERLSSCATPMKYIDILNLDRKIREFDDLRIEERYEVAELTGPEEVEKLQVQSWRNIGISLPVYALSLPFSDAPMFQF